MLLLVGLTLSSAHGEPRRLQFVSLLACSWLTLDSNGRPPLLHKAPPDSAQPGPGSKELLQARSSASAGASAGTISGLGEVAKGF
jgi:hypothetical protein